MSKFYPRLVEYAGQPITVFVNPDHRNIDESSLFVPLSVLESIMEWAKGTAEKTLRNRRPLVGTVPIAVISSNQGDVKCLAFKDFLSVYTHGIEIGGAKAESMIHSGMKDSFRQKLSPKLPIDERLRKIESDYSVSIAEACFEMESDTDKNQRSGFIYVCGTEGSMLCKIGMTTTSVESRMASLRCGNPGIRLIAAFPTMDARNLESRLHRYFSSRRKSGEWFDFSGMDDSLVASVVHDAVKELS